MRDIFSVNQQPVGQMNTVFSCARWQVDSQSGTLTREAFVDETSVGP